MARKDWYTAERVGPGQYLVRKINEHFEQTEVYNIGQDRADGPLHCDCFAGLMGKHCRHKQLVATFATAEAFGTGLLYSFDRAEWLSPKKGELIDIETLEM